MPDRPSFLETVLAEAIAFARAHDVQGPIEPRDFGIQRSASGLTHATYVSGDHVVSVLVDRHGRTCIALGEVDWIHDGSDDDGPCDDCETDAGRPFRTVYLPGDGPEGSTDV